MTSQKNNKIIEEDNIRAVYVIGAGMAIFIFIASSVAGEVGLGLLFGLAWLLFFGGIPFIVFEFLKSRGYKVKKSTKSESSFTDGILTFLVDGIGTVVGAVIGIVVFIIVIWVFLIILRALIRFLIN